jgi:uncharacterized NAD(P)/FAD-binding protein YdhS
LTIAIVGSGFSGTMLAVHLLRKATQGHLRVVLIEKGSRFAKGVAYGTMCPLHLLNVPAGDMTAFPDQPQHFFNWAKAQDPSTQTTTFVQRLLYGRYIEQLLNEADESKAVNIKFEKVHDEVVAIDLAADGKSAEVKLAGGKSIAANRVVLALGNFAPGNPPVKDMSFYQSKRYFQDPWLCDAIDDPDEAVLLIGTGLTAVDKALQLHASGHSGVIYMLSRHGLMPQVHKIGLTKLPVPFDVQNLPKSARELFHFLRVKAKEAGNSGNGTESLDWRQVVDSIRPVTQKIWQGFPPEEQKKFIRHLRCLWDVHRHRIAPDVGAAIEKMKNAGVLQLIAARIIKYKEDENGVDITIRPRFSNEEKVIRVSAVINCTGPEPNYSRITEPMIVSLYKQGIIGSDPMRLGMHVAESYALKDKNGKVSEVFFTLGPPLKGLLWESVAVPELRVQAAKLADELVPSAVPTRSII